MDAYLLRQLQQDSFWRLQTREHGHGSIVIGHSGMLCVDTPLVLFADATPEAPACHTALQGVSYVTLTAGAHPATPHGLNGRAQMLAAAVGCTVSCGSVRAFIASADARTAA